MVVQNYPSGFIGQTQPKLSVTQVEPVKEEVPSSSRIGEKVITKDMKQSEINRIKRELNKEGLDIDSRYGKVVPKGYYYTNTGELRKSKPKYTAEVVQTSTGPEIVTYGKVPSALIERRVSQLQQLQEQTAKDVVYTEKGEGVSKAYALQTQAERERSAQISSRMISTKEGVKYGSVYSGTTSGASPYDTIASVDSKEGLPKTIQERPKSELRASEEVFGKPTLYSKLIRKQEEAKEMARIKPEQAGAYNVKGYVYGAVSVPLLIVTQPKEFIKGIWSSVTHPRQALLSVGESLRTEPEFFIGQQVGGYYTFKGVGKVGEVSPKFSSEGIMKGTIKEVPSTVIESTRAKLFLKGAGISEQTIDIGTSKIPYASYSPKEYVKVAETVSPTREPTYTLMRLDVPEPRQVRTVETPVYKGSKYEIIEGRATPTRLSEKPVYIKTTELFKGESGTEATITKRGLTFEPTGKIPLVEVSRFPFESQKIVIYPKLAKIREGEIALSSDMNIPSKLVKEFTVESKTSEFPSLAKAKAESDIASAQQPLTFKNVDVKVGEVSLSYGKIPEANIFEKVVPTERGLTAFEYRPSERVPSIKSFEPLRVKLLEGVEGEQVKVTGFNIEPTKATTPTSSFRTVKSNVQEYKLSKGESVSREGEVLKTKAPEVITYEEVIAKPLEAKTETFLDVYGKTKPSIPKSQATLEGLPESVGASDLVKPISKQEYYTTSKVSNILYSGRKEEVLFIPSIKTRLESVSLSGSGITPAIKTSLESGTSLEIMPITSVKQAQQQKQVQEQKQLLELKTIQEQKVSSREAEITRVQEPVKPFEYPKPISYIPSSKDKKKSKKASLYVRRKGKFELKGISEDVEGLFKRGREIVEQTASASFKVVEDSGKAILPNILPSKFTKSKRDAGVLVQKREFRIGTAGEKREITYKGIQARRLI